MLKHVLSRVGAIGALSFGFCLLSNVNSFALTDLQKSQMSCTTKTGASDTSFVDGTTSMDNRTWVSRLYLEILGRNADPSGLQNWGNALNTGMPRLTVVDGFLTSREYCGNTVTALYSKLLNRRPDAGGFSSWTNACQTGTDMITVETNFCNSAEYQNTHYWRPMNLTISNNTDKNVFVDYVPYFTAGGTNFNYNEFFDISKGTKLSREISIPDCTSRLGIANGVYDGGPQVKLLASCGILPSLAPSCSTINASVVISESSPGTYKCTVTAN